MKSLLTQHLLTLGLAVMAATVQASGPIRASEGIGFYVGVDGLATLAGGTYVGLANPNAGRLTLLFDHGDHFHGIGSYSYTGPASAPTVLGTNLNNRLPEPYTRVDEAHSAIELMAGSGTFAGSWVSGVLPDGAATHDYSYLGIASVQSLSGLSAAADVLYGSSGGRWSGSLANTTVALRLDAVSPGLKVAAGGNSDVFAGGVGSLYELGSSTSFTFMPTFHISGSAAPGTYTAQFSLVNTGSNAAVNAGGTFFYDFAVPSPVPEPQSWLLMAAGLGVMGWLRRQRR